MFAKLNCLLIITVANPINAESRGCTNPESQVAVKIKFCTMERNNVGFLVSRLAASVV